MKHGTPWWYGCVLGFAASCSLTAHDSASDPVAGGAADGGTQGGTVEPEVAGEKAAGQSPGNEQPAGPGGSGASTPVGAGSVGDSCGAILTCVQECPDDACITACAGRGSSNARQLFDDLLACLTLNACDDAACLQLSCQSEASACTQDGESDSSSNGGAPGSDEPALPAQLVGEWATSDGSTAYQFEADGSYRYVFRYNSSLACIAYLSRTITEIGRVSARGETLTTVGSSRTTETQACDFSSTTDEDGGKTQSYRYTVSGGALILVDANGNALTLLAQP